MAEEYEGDTIRKLVLERGFLPVISSQCKRTAPWGYDRELYRRCNGAGCLLQRLKGFRRIFSRLDRPYVISPESVTFGLIVEFLRLC